MQERRRQRFCFFPELMIAERLHILVITNNSDTFLRLGRLLLSCGIPVHVERATGLSQALAKLSRSFAVCLLDVSAGSAAELRQMIGERDLSIPVILLTDSQPDATLAGALPAGPCEGLCKAALSADGLRLALRYAVALGSRGQVRPLAEEALHISEERFQLAVRATGDIVWDWDIVADRLWWSDRFWSEFGYDPATFPRNIQGWLDCVHPDDQERVSAASHDEYWSAEYRLRRANGEWVCVLDRAYLLRDAKGRRLRMIGALTDLTARKRAEQALRDSEERYRMLFERNLAGVFRSSFAGGLLECNDALRRMFGYDSREEFYQVPTDKLFADPTQREEVRRLVLAQQQVANWESEMLRKDGSHFPALSNIVLLHDKTGQPIGLQGTVLDISETRKLQQQLFQSQKMEAIGALAGGIAHDFNNLLMVITSHSELLVAHLTGKDRYRATQVLEAARRATQLTRHLLTFSRKQAVNLQLLDLNAVVRSFGSMLPRLIGENIELDFRLASELHAIRADPVQIEQVIMNLAVNARDAMPHGGRLCIETANFELDSGGEPRLGIPPGRYAVLAITDNGSGMDANIQAHLFEPLFTTKEPGKGTGLGLATVYGIVQQSGGHIFVYSEVGHGTTFKIYLPWAVECGQAQASVRSTPAVPGGSETILLVEDEAALREAVAEFLQARGYAVLSACDGVEALQLAAVSSDPIDLLLTDVVMPRMSGQKLHECLRRSRPDLRVLYISGYTETTLLQHGISDRSAYFLQKPVSFAALAQSVRQALDVAAVVAAPG